MAISQALTHKLQEELADCVPGPVSVVLAMRYGEPAIDRVLKEVRRKP